jgi:hypothetical protein
LPVSGRDFRAIVSIFPGFQTNPTSGQNNYTLSSGSTVSFNGTGTRGTSFTTDGIGNDDYSGNQNRQQRRDRQRNASAHQQLLSRIRTGILAPWSWFPPSREPIRRMATPTGSTPTAP